MVTRIGPRKPTRLYIAEWRAYRDDMSGEQLAARVSEIAGTRTTKGQISKWENHKRDITIGVLTVLAEALRCKPMDLFGPPPTQERPSVSESVRLVHGLRSIGESEAEPDRAPKRARGR